MAITYPVDAVNTRWAIHDAGTGQIIARNQSWPRGDGGEIQGLDPNYTYCLQIADAQPQYDSRTHFLEGIETIDLPENELRTSWASNQRPLEERETSIDNRESEEAERHMRRRSLQAEVAEHAIVLAILIDKIEGLDLPPRKQSLFDRAKVRGLKLFRNRINAEQKKQQEASGSNPDHDDGWEPED